MSDEQTRTCRTCGERKPLAAFQERVGLLATGPETHLRTCLVCNRARENRGQNQYTVERDDATIWQDADPSDDAVPLTRAQWKARLLARVEVTHE